MARFDLVDDKLRTSVIKQMLLNRERAYLVNKAVCYVGLLVLSCMVEDSGEFQAALMCAVIITELALLWLVSEFPWLARPWAGPVVAFVVINVILLIWAIFGLPDPFDVPG